MSVSGFVRGLLTIGDPGQASTLHGGKPFNRPTHSAISPQDRRHLHLRHGNSRVHKFDPKGRHLQSWGESGTDPGCYPAVRTVARTTPMMSPAPVTADSA